VAKEQKAVPVGDGACEIRVTRLSVQSHNEPLWSECSTDVCIDTDALKEVVVVRQKSGHVDVELQTIYFRPHEWPAVRSAIDFMVSECRDQ
jgi:hypothetical protein